MFITNRKRVISRCAQVLVMSLVGYAFPNFKDILNLDILLSLSACSVTGTRQLHRDCHRVLLSRGAAFCSL